MQPEKNSEKDPEKRPGIIFVGSPNVGKRTLVSRLTSIDFEETSDSSSLEQEILNGWTINTKYYTADVSIRIAHFHDGFSITTLPEYTQLAALVMVFDMNERSTLTAVQDWVSHNDLQRFEILLCIGNKVDLVPSHSVHTEYRRRFLKIGHSENSDLDYADYGILETEGSSLLGNKEPSWESRNSCLEWCMEHNIEFVEACASNPDFDKCLSINGDSQGIERLFGALSANMWPGMILKSGDKITEPSLPEREDLSEEESDYELEYERLSDGSAEPWDDTDNGWVSASGTVGTSSMDESSSKDNINSKDDLENGNKCDWQDMPASTSKAASSEQTDESMPAPNQATNTNESLHFDFDELEQLMMNIGNVRENLRLMPDFQRREMAANLALKMAAMFGGGSDCEDEN